MTLYEFVNAFGALQSAISRPRDKKPKSLVLGAKPFARGTTGKVQHLIQLSSMTMEELFELRYQLGKEVSDAEYKKTNPTKKTLRKGF